MYVTQFTFLPNAHSYICGMRDTDENPGIRHFRSDSRLFCADGEWWFSTREGEEGPYANREEAELGLERFIQAQKILKHMITRKVVSPNPRRLQIDTSIWDRQIDLG